MLTMRFAFKYRWIILAIALGTTVGCRFWSSTTGLPSPYRYQFSRSPADNSRIILQREIAFYQERIRQNPEDGLDRASLATAYLKMARATRDDSWYLLAEQSARRSLANLPFSNEGAILALARIAEAKHNFSTAIELAQQVRQTHSNNQNALSILVSANLAIGNVDEANRFANLLVEQIPSLNSLTLRALVRIARGEDEIAIADFQQALTLEEPGERGSSAWTRTLLGRFYFQRGQHKLASKLYQEALRILPGYSLALVNLAKLETRRGQYQEAEGYYSQILASSASPNVLDHVALIGMAHVKNLQGDRPSAEELWKQAELSFHDHHNLNEFGHIHDHHNLNEFGHIHDHHNLNEFEHIHDHHNLNEFGHRRELAELLLQRGRPEDLAEALLLMQAELEVRRDAETLDMLAWVLSRLGRWNDARKAIREALETGVRDAGIFYRAGIIEEALGDEERAIAYFQLAKETDPTFDKLTGELLGLYR